MKKLVMMMVGLGLILGTTAFAQDTKTDAPPKKEKKAKKEKSSKKKTTDTTAAPADKK
jgi:hypothetical protein